MPMPTFPVVVSALRLDNDVMSVFAPEAAAPRFVRAAAAIVAPVPPCPSDKAVVRPVSDVMSALEPDEAAPRFVRAIAAVVAPVPPCATVSVPDVISLALIVPQAGILAAVPVPVLVRNCLDDVLFPANLVSVPLAPPTSRSPRLVSGERASNAALAVVAPVPPLAMATVPETLEAIPESVALIVPPLTALPETFPAVLIVASLVSAMFAFAATSESVMVVDPAVTRPLVSTVTFA